MGEWFMAVTEHPAIQEELNQWNARILFPTPLAQYNIMGKVPIKTVEDFDGVRIRIDPVSGVALEDFGAVLTMMPAPDIYTALERGMLDSVVWIWTYTFGAYKLYELSQYATLGVDLKVTDMFVYARQDAWNALPEEWKKLSNFSTAKSINRYANYMAQADLKWIPIFNKAGIEVTQFPPEERAKLVAKAESAWNAWAKDKEDKGLPGKDVLKFAIAKREEIIAKYAKK
jgi:TRAP-type C4-dicarboxylate transport system substrate-binding protein